jgi:hypothetical protein
MAGLVAIEVRRALLALAVAFVLTMIGAHFFIMHLMGAI